MIDLQFTDALRTLSEIDGGGSMLGPGGAIRIATTASCAVVAVWLAAMASRMVHAVADDTETKRPGFVPERRTVVFLAVIPCLIMGAGLLGMRAVRSGLPIEHDLRLAAEAPCSVVADAIARGRIEALPAADRDVFLRRCEPTTVVAALNSPDARFSLDPHP